MNNSLTKLSGSLFPPIEFFGPSVLRRELPTLAVDIHENEKGYTVKADVPGFEPDEISIEFNKDVLSITAEKHEDHIEKDDSGKIVSERHSVNSKSRKIFLGRRIVDSDNIEAHVDNGVLTLEIPFAAEEVTVKKIDVKKTVGSTKDAKI